MNKFRLGIIGVVIVAVIGVAGWGYWQYQYSVSPEKVADEVITGVTNDDIETVYESLSEGLQRGDREYWRGAGFYMDLRGYDGPVNLESKEAAVSEDPSLPDPYAPGTEAWRMVYSMSPRGKMYNLSMDVVRTGETWKVADISGGYVAQ